MEVKVTVVMKVVVEAVVEIVEVKVVVVIKVVVEVVVEMFN